MSTPTMTPTWLMLLLAALTLLLDFASSQSLYPKRGLAYHDPVDRSEYNIFWTINSSVTWYYNWSPWPSSTAPRTGRQFLPLIPQISDISSILSTVQSIPNGHPPHSLVLTFNEPDGSVASGGSDISPQDAAAAYVKYVVPLRSQGFQISHPSTTGTGSGLAWLSAFNASCYALAPESGCPLDFIATHFYGDFPALTSWLGTLHSFYGTQQNLSIYLTEFALPQVDAATALAMMNQTLPYLDALDYVSGYAWFGLFRTTEANNWTGPGVSLLDADAGLTELGSLYLGGPERGFGVGMRSGKDTPVASVGSNERGRGKGLGLGLGIVVMVVTVIFMLMVR